MQACQRGTVKEPLLQTRLVEEYLLTEPNSTLLLFLFDFQKSTPSYLLSHPLLFLLSVGEKLFVEPFDNCIGQKHFYLFFFEGDFLVTVLLALQINIVYDLSFQSYR